MDSRPYIGLPFKDHGRGLDGYDCWGLVREVYKREWGIDLPSYTERYGSALEHAEVAALIGYGREQGWTPVPKGQERAGDLVILRLRGEPWHVGVVVEPGYMLHVHRKTSAVVEPYTGIVWRNRVQEFLRWQ